MKVKMDVVLTDLDGSPLKVIRREGEEPTNRTLKETCRTSLLVYDDKMSGEEKYESFKLAQKIENAPKDGVDLTSEEITKIKKAIGKYQFPIVVGIAWDLLEGK